MCEGLLLADGSYPIFGSHIQLPNIQACITHLTQAQPSYCGDTTGGATIPGTGLCHITWLYAGFKVVNMYTYTWCVWVCIDIACSLKITYKICSWVPLCHDPILLNDIILHTAVQKMRQNINFSFDFKGHPTSCHFRQAMWCLLRGLWTTTTNTECYNRTVLLSDITWYWFAIIKCPCAIYNNLPGVWVVFLKWLLMGLVCATISFWVWTQPMGNDTC